MTFILVVGGIILLASAFGTWMNKVNNQRKRLVLAQRRHIQSSSTLDPFRDAFRFGDNPPTPERS